MKLITQISVVELNDYNNEMAPFHHFYLSTMHGTSYIWQVKIKVRFNKSITIIGLILNFLSSQPEFRLQIKHGFDSLLFLRMNLPLASL